LHKYQQALGPAQATVLLAVAKPLTGYSAGRLLGRVFGRLDAAAAVEEFRKFALSFLKVG